MIHHLPILSHHQQLGGSSGGFPIGFLEFLTHTFSVSLPPANLTFFNPHNFSLMGNQGLESHSDVQNEPATHLYKGIRQCCKAITVITANDRHSEMFHRHLEDVYLIREAHVICNCHFLKYIIKLCILLIAYIQSPSSALILDLPIINISDPCASCLRR